MALHDRYLEDIKTVNSALSGIFVTASATLNTESATPYWATPYQMTDHPLVRSPLPLAAATGLERDTIQVIHGIIQNAKDTENQEIIDYVVDLIDALSDIPADMSDAQIAFQDAKARADLQASLFEHGGEAQHILSSLILDRTELGKRLTGETVMTPARPQL